MKKAAGDASSAAVVVAVGVTKTLTSRMIMRLSRGSHQAFAACSSVNLDCSAL